MMPTRTRPQTFGLFEKRIQGDDCLWELAQARFQHAGMGAEFHASTPRELDDRLKYRPPGDCMAHLARDMNLLATSDRIFEFALRYAGTVRGLIIHDSVEMSRRPDDYIAAARDMNARLEQIPNSPTLFVEYAIGLPPVEYIRFFQSIAGLGQISACIDTGHVGIRAIRDAYSIKHAGKDVVDFRNNAEEIPGEIEGIQASLAAALSALSEMIHALKALGKPIHYHLHDGHPLSVSSPYGVCDHLSFLETIPLGFEFHGHRSAPPMFGHAGLARIVGLAAEVAEASFTLEIHPVFSRLELGEYSPRFIHWRDKTNAELMNHWLWTLERNHALLLEALDSALHKSPKNR